MLRDRYSPDDWADSQQGTSSCQSLPRLVLGLFVLSIVAGYTALLFVRGGSPRVVGLLVPILGAVMGTALLGEYISSRCRSRLYQCLWLPAIELIATYSLFGVLVGAVFYGLAVTAAVSAVLLFCSFLAFILTL